jgi:hypothetical protein
MTPGFVATAAGRTPPCCLVDAERNQRSEDLSLLDGVYCRRLTRFVVLAMLASSRRASQPSDRPGSAAISVADVRQRNPL